MTANRLYFMQHGLAMDKTENPDRPLTEDGFKQTRNVAKQLLLSGIAISTIFHSGKLRAQQTAEIIAATLNIKSLSAADYLSPNDETALVIQQLNADRALYVGHLPQLEKLVSVLVTGNEEADIIQFQNSSVICLQKGHDLYRILWYLTPQLSTFHHP